jgi:NADP-dependent alcohol dehydrogenase
LDGAKFIAAAYYYQGIDPWDILAHNEEIIDALPLGVVLTLPATGSEMNGNAVITRQEFKEKLSFGSPLVLSSIFCTRSNSCCFSSSQANLATE